MYRTKWPVVFRVVLFNLKHQEGRVEGLKPSSLSCDIKSGEAQMEALQLTMAFCFFKVYRRRLSSRPRHVIVRNGNLLMIWEARVHWIRAHNFNKLNRPHLLCLLLLFTSKIWLFSIRKWTALAAKYVRVGSWNHLDVNWDKLSTNCLGNCWLLATGRLRTIRYLSALRSIYAAPIPYLAYSVEFALAISKAP